MVLEGFTWGCIPEITTNCQDMTNASSTYLSIVIGVVVGAVISWLIYSRQKNTSDKQDLVLNWIRELQERQESLLKKIEKIDERNEAILNRILELDEKTKDSVTSRGPE